MPTNISGLLFLQIKAEEPLCPQFLYNHAFVSSGLKVSSEEIHKL